jgi:non-ribosomal peptide synthase protein (TIGR01720 family)
MSPIAIVGMSGRFPGAPTLDAFWQNLSKGVESISFFAEKELAAAGIDRAEFSQPHYVRARAIVDEAECFDAAFFDFTPREAEYLDPQHRLLLECAWEALEDAGYDSVRYPGSIGVFAGTGVTTYLFRLLSGRSAMPVDSFLAVLANDKDFLTTRISYKLNLTGPSLDVQTACSTSLVAMSLACQSLLNYQCDMALAGGVCVYVPQKSGYLYREGDIFSPDGHCRAFDAQAHGTVNGNGAGLVVLKRLEDALADGDQIYALIRGFAINNDGSLKVGYTAPSVDAQAEAIATAQALAGVQPETITYVEAHGTGTQLGDPVEIAALTQAFRASTAQKNFCAIGSVKTNIGHLDAAAGVAGLIKTVLALRHKMIPPTLHFERANPKIDFANSPFYVNTKLAEWNTNGVPRRAGVSSFGVGGTNVHLVLEEGTQPTPSGESRAWQLLSLSAKTSTALERMTANLGEYLKQRPDLDLADVAYTLHAGRRTFEHRRVLVCQNSDDAIHALESLDPKRVFTDASSSKNRPVAFMFSGQGTQYVNMGLELYQTEPVFRQAVDTCCGLLKPHLGLDLRDVLYMPAEKVNEESAKLTQTAIAQPAIFVTEYALAELWMAWGVQPQAMIGHSIGEYVAACLAGVFSLQDGLALVAARARMMQQLPGGAMLNVSLSEEDVMPLLGERLALAAINGPSRCVVSGPTDAVEMLANDLAQRGVGSSRLNTSHAFHSGMMDALLKPFADRVRQVKLNAPQIPYVSNVTGTWITAVEAMDPDYWARHLRQTVRFGDGIRTLLQGEERVLLEVGPGQSLGMLAKRSCEAGRKPIVLSSLRDSRDTHSDMEFLVTTLGKLGLAGVQVHWPAYYAHERRHRVSLPTYPFERRRYWVELAEELPETRVQQTLAKKPDIADWFYVPSWKRSMPPIPFEQGQLAGQRLRWLVFLDECGLGDCIVERLQAAGQDVVTVKVGDEFTQLGESAFGLNPQKRGDYDALLSALGKSNEPATRIVHLWQVCRSETGLSSNLINQAQYRGFYSLLFLTQSLGQQNGVDPARIVALSNDMQRVTGEKRVCPEKATVLGVCRTLPLEYPNLTCQSVDIALPEAEGLGRLADQMISEIIHETPDVVVAYRGRDRWVQTFEPAHLDASSSRSLLKKNGVYMITGGLGGIGPEIARYLARSAQARLVLVGRSPFPDRKEWNRRLTDGGDDDIARKIRTVQALEADGAQVLILGADVTDLDQVRAAITRTQSYFGALHGVIHAAGIAGGGMIQLKTQEMASQVLAPKVTGTWNLAQALQDVPLDFFVLFSSVVSIAGIIGRADYAAANAFLDAFAYHLSMVQPDWLTVSINWDAWQGIGMDAQTGLLDRLYRDRPGQTMAHPLLDECIEISAERAVYRVILDTKLHWVLSEHNVMGRPTLPGTSHIEMVRAAFEHYTGHPTADMSDVYFLKPLMMSDQESREVRVILEKSGDVCYFHLVSKVQADGQAERTWQEHSYGKIDPLAIASSETHDVKHILQRCQAVQIDPSLPVYGKSGDDIYWGPRWHSLKEVYVGAHERLALLEMPPEFMDDLTQFKLHPALLDTAVSFAGQFGGNDVYLPISYERIKIIKPLPSKFYSHARYDENAQMEQETISFDILLMDEMGQELAVIEGYTLKRITSKAGLRLRDRDGNPADPSSSAPTSGFTGYVGPLDWAGELGSTFDSLSEGMSPGEGIETFRRILDQNILPQLVVFARDLNAAMTRLHTLLPMHNDTGADKTTYRTLYPRPAVQTAYAPPRNEMELALCDIWQRVLGIEQIGIHDNFFELGGDSILGIQVVALAKKAGLQLGPNLLFQHQTISDLATQVSKVHAAEVEQSVVIGTVPLTPIQSWFLAQELPNVHHWNQAILLTSQARLNLSFLAQLVQALLAHHDALRLRFMREGSGWQQFNVGKDDARPLICIDLSALSDATQELAITVAMADLQASLDVGKGPLMRVAWFERGKTRPSQLLIVVHHLAVDALSWPILTADLQTAYEQLGRGEAIRLPPKTTAYKTWAERLAEYSRSDEVLSELGFWLSEPRRRSVPLPLDDGAGLETNTEASARTLSVSLDAQETQALLQQVPQAYNTQASEVVITALAQSLAQWTGERTVLIDLEGNGRNVYFKGVDLSRTVGWFTTLFPVLLDLSQAVGPGEALKAIKEQLRAVPREGIGYGLLRYARGDTDLAQKIDAMPQAQISFLYLGQIDQLVARSDLLGSFQELAGLHDAQGKRRYLLDVRGSVVAGRLSLEWIYSDRLHRRATVEKLAQQCLQNLQALIRHCQSLETGSYTPSDFPAAGLNQQELDELASLLGGVAEED